MVAADDAFTTSLIGVKDKIRVALEKNIHTTTTTIE